MRNSFIIILLLFSYSCVENSIINSELRDIGITSPDLTVCDTIYYNNKSIKQLTFRESESEYFKVVFYESGKKKSLIHVKDSQCQGEYIDWYENGNIEWIRYYDKGMQIGESKTYFEDGVIKNIFNNVNSEQTDYYSNGNIKQVLSNGKSITYYTNGIVKELYKMNSNDTAIVVYNNEDGTNVFNGKYVSGSLYYDDSKFTGEIICYFNNG